MKEAKWLGHQGDVNFFEIEEFPKGERIQDQQTKAGILAYGEATGHCHEIIEQDHVEVFKILDRIYLNVLKEINIRHGLEKNFSGITPDHDYHNTISLKPGKYLIGITPVRDPMTGLVRKVMD